MEKKFNGDGTPLTTSQVVDQREAFDQFWMLRSAFLESIDSILSFAEAGEQAELLVKTVEEFAAAAKPLLTSIAQVVKSADVEKDLKKAVSLAENFSVEERIAKIHEAMEPLEKREDDSAMATKQELEATVEELTVKVAALIETATKAEELTKTNSEEIKIAHEKEIETLKSELEKVKKQEPASGNDEEEILKSMTPGQRKLFETQKSEQETLRAEVEKSRKIATEQRDLRLKDEFIQKASGMTSVPGLTADDCWETFKNISETMPEAWAQIEKLLAAAHNTIKESSKLAKEIGANGSLIDKPGSGSAEAEINAKAKEHLDAGRVATIAAGVAKVTRDDKELYKRHRMEKRNGQ